MVKLVLPLPPSVLNNRKAHPMAEYRAKNKYRAECWAAAIKQVMPRAREDLPERVRVRATFYVRNRRDEADNLPASLKWALDCLKQEQTGSVKWRQGVYDEKGYLIDDDPAHCIAEQPTQHIDRKNTRLELELIDDERKD